MKILKLSIFALLLSTGLTSTVVAAWWNPYTWFNNRQAPAPRTEVTIKTASILKATSTSGISNTNKQINKKAEKVQINKQVETTVVSSSSPKENPLPSISSENKMVTLSISNSSGGYVSSEYNGKGGIDCYSQELCSKEFPYGKHVTLTAVANPGYVFSSWSDTACESKNTCSITLTDNKTIQVTFKIAGPKTPKGKITSPSHASTSCGILTGQDSCTILVAWYVEGAVEPRILDNGTRYLIDAVGENAPLALNRGTHILTLLDRGGDILDKVTIISECVQGSTWYGSKCTAPNTKMLAVFSPEQAIVKSDTPGISCGTYTKQCIADFPANTIVTLTASVQPGRSFGEWNGDCSGTEPTCKVLMDRSRTVNFTIK